MSSNNLIDFNQLSRYNDKVKSKFETKVDKIEGKGLSTNDYTNEEKEKLEKLENYNDSALSERVSTIEEDYLTSTDKKELSDKININSENFTDFSEKINTNIENLTKEINEKIDLKANLESPILTGTPSAPTAAAGTNTNQIATTSFVQTAKQEAITTILGETVNADFDTLQEVADWIQADTTASAELITRVSDTETNIENLQTDLAKKYDSTATREANTFLAGPDGNAGGGAFRKIVTNDLPIVPISKGGTGATTAKGAEYAINGGVTEFTTAMTDSGEIIMKYTEPNSEKGVFIYRKAILFWNYIKEKFTGAISNIITSNLTASRALTSDANGKIAVSAVTSTELGYLDGVTSAIQTQLNNKVTVVSGKGLSTNDYTTAEKEKLSGIAAGAEVNVQSDWSATSGDAFIKNKPTFLTGGSQTSTSSADGGSNVYTFTKSDGTTSTLTVKNGSKGSTGATGATGPKGDTGATGATGTRGSLWYSGTGVTGTSTTATIFSSSGISSALVNDYYLNTSTGYVYKCTTAGAASAAKWVYVGSIKGATGATGSQGPTGTTPTIKVVAGSNINAVGTPTVTASTSGTTTTFTFNYLKGATGANATTTAVATTSANGLMSSSDKTKLNGIETGATKTTVSFDKTKHALLINP